MPILRLPCSFPAIESLAIPAVSVLISFLAYTSQYLFQHIEPGPLSRSETIWFNIVVGAIWWSYYHACTVDPGKKGWVEKFAVKKDSDDGEELQLVKGMRWCKKCEAVKPPRAHHCKKCKRCIPKMDHHCPWTANCVSHTTLPHFMRFVSYAVLGLSMLAYHLFTRAMVIWDSRDLPAYLGPSVTALAHLIILCVVNSFTLFALSLLFIQTTHNLIHNTTMIEGWEIERHEALVERARKQGGFVYANGGQKVRIVQQEFPYDIGYWKNLCQAAGTSHLWMWPLPFGGGPSVNIAGNWEVNGFEDEGTVWPPLDPDKMPRRIKPAEFATREEYNSIDEEKRAFKSRQANDLQRWQKKDDAEESSEEEDDGYELEQGIDGNEGWTNSDGDRLRDYGVDEEAELTDEDDIPLGELLRRRKARASE